MLFYNNDIYTNPIQFHSHDYFEIYFFMNGYVKYYVENEEYDMKKDKSSIIISSMMILLSTSYLAFLLII